MVTYFPGNLYLNLAAQVERKKKKRSLLIKQHKSEMHVLKCNTELRNAP